MKKRIKIVYTLTVIAILLLVGVQGMWISTQYKISATELTKEIEKEVELAVVDEYEIRQARVDKENKVISHGAYVFDTKKSKTLIDIYFFDAKVYNKFEMIEDSNRDSIIALADCSYVFEVKEAIVQDKLYAAPDMFSTDEIMPFSVTTLDSLLREQNIEAEICTYKVDSIVWETSSERDMTFFRTTITLDTPYDNLEGECVQVKFSLPLPDLIAKMGVMLGLSVFAFIFIVYSFYIQIHTINHQRRIEKIRRDFLHSMIHELKRPISALKMCVSSLRNEKLILDKEFRDEVLQNSSSELNNITNYFTKLRDITMAEKGNIPLSKTNIIVPEFMKEIITRVWIPSDKLVNIEVIGSEILTINADSLHFENMIQNLIENAIKYSYNSVDIKISYTVDGKYFSLMVSDNGYGISEFDRKYIFDKFYRSDTKEYIQGMGLGLSYIKMIAEAHNGSIEVESELGKGSTFILKIPK